MEEGNSGNEIHNSHPRPALISVASMRCSPDMSSSEGEGSYSGRSGGGAAEAGCSSNSSDSPGFDSVGEVYTFTLPDLSNLTDEFRYSTYTKDTYTA